MSWLISTSRPSSLSPSRPSPSTLPRCWNGLGYLQRGSAGELRGEALYMCPNPVSKAPNPSLEMYGSRSFICCLKARNGSDFWCTSDRAALPQYLHLSRCHHRSPIGNRGGCSHRTDAVRWNMRAQRAHRSYTKSLLGAPSTSDVSYASVSGSCSRTCWASNPHLDSQSALTPGLSSIVIASTKTSCIGERSQRMCRTSGCQLPAVVPTKLCWGFGHKFTVPHKLTHRGGGAGCRDQWPGWSAPV